jgi:hypothetical protein
MLRSHLAHDLRPWELILNLPYEWALHDVRLGMSWAELSGHVPSSEESGVQKLDNELRCYLYSPIVKGGSKLGERNPSGIV